MLSMTEYSLPNVTLIYMLSLYSLVKSIALSKNTNLITVEKRFENLFWRILMLSYSIFQVNEVPLSRQGARTTDFYLNTARHHFPEISCH